MSGDVNKWPDFLNISPMPHAVRFYMGTSFLYSRGTLWLPDLNTLSLRLEPGCCEDCFAPVPQTQSPLKDTGGECKALS